MLRIFSSKIFREDLYDFSLPMWAFKNFDDVKLKIDMKRATYKFCLPVSIGDFAETNVPACFSNNEEELCEFVKVQKELNNRKAFIISDFQVDNIEKICFSGIINANSTKGLCGHLDKTTIIDLTLKNPILTYSTEKISPRDLPADVELEYDHIDNCHCAFPKINVKRDCVDLNKYKDIIFDAYIAASKIHKVAKMYDGDEYCEYALFFVDDKNKLWLYEIIGAESFLGTVNCNRKMIVQELDLVQQK